MPLKSSKPDLLCAASRSRQEPDKTLIDVVDRTLNLHAFSLRKNNVTVDFLKDNSIPYALGDPHQLMQVFLNLIVNAEQAIREGRDKGTLRIRLAKGDNAVSVSFHDDGPGIAKEYLSSIFDPFYTTKRPGRGTGLGLSICKSVMKEHNGSGKRRTPPKGAPCLPCRCRWRR